MAENYEQRAEEIGLPFRESTISAAVEHEPQPWLDRCQWSAALVGSDPQRVALRLQRLRRSYLYRGFHDSMEEANRYPFKAPRSIDRAAMLIT